MKKIIVAVALPLFFAWSSVGLAETCYTVEGEVKTENDPEKPQIQVGSIELLLLDQEDDEAFRENGNLIGTITGANEFGAAILSHSAIFEDGSTFVTSGDVAQIMGIRKFAEDGTPCSFFVREAITKIVFGTGFFAQPVNSVDIVADGYIDACIEDGDNENEFELTGKLCFD
jgi:hypothetical protein